MNQPEHFHRPAGSDKFSPQVNEELQNELFCFPHIQIPPSPLERGLLFHPEAHTALLQ